MRIGCQPLMLRLPLLLNLASFQEDYPEAVAKELLRFFEFGADEK